MESPARYTPHQSKKRVFPGSSSSCMDPDVVEISPPMNWSSKSKSSRKKVEHREVITIEPDDDPQEVIYIGEELDFSYKGKQSANVSHNNMTTIKSANGVQSSKSIDVQGAHEFLGNGFSEHDFVYDDDYMNLFQDGAVFDDNYGFLQAQFDTIDIPTEIEAPAPWFTDVENKKKVDSVSSLNHPFSHVQLNANGIGSSHAWGKDHFFPSSSSWQTPVAAKQPYGTMYSSSSAFLKSLSNNNNSDAPASSHKLSSKIATSASSLLSRVTLNSPGSSCSKWKQVPGSSNHSPALSDLGSVEHPSQPVSHLKNHPSQPVSYLNNYYPKNVQDKRAWFKSTKIIPESGTSNPVNSEYAHLLKAMTMGSPYFDPSVAGAVHLPHEEMFGVNGAGHPALGSTAPSGSISTTSEQKNQEDIMKDFQLFKQFDTVEDYSDHYYSKHGSSVMQQPKAWAKRIQDEWKILEKDLPEAIFVRVYESRMDLLRAVIVGAQGTPYHDGLFFFDVFFPSGYPSVPPHVYYHSGGLRINPNLYNCGKVCLSLLNTWTGSGNEKWIPKVSTMLQVLVSIQALILNENPYFNEPGYARSARSAAGEQKSQAYSENVFLLSLKAMVYTMRKPPKHFEDFVIGHFCKYVQDILGACKVYIEGGLAVGSVTKGEAKNVVGNTKKCSPHFKGNVSSYIRMLVQAFVQIGAKDCDKFLSLAPVAGAYGQLPAYQPPPYFY